MRQLFVVSWVLFGLGTSLADEKIPLKEVPKAVVDAVNAKFPKAEVVQAEKEVEDGVTYYELAIKFNGNNIDVTSKADGEIVEIETEIKPTGLPKEVIGQLDAKYPKAEIKKAEYIASKEVTKYEVLLLTADKQTVEVVFETRWILIKEEKKTDKEDE